MKTYLQNCCFVVSWPRDKKKAQKQIQSLNGVY